MKDHGRKTSAPSLFGSGDSSFVRGLSSSSDGEHAYDAVLEAGAKTRDLGGELGADAFAKAVIDRLAD